MSRPIYENAKNRQDEVWAQEKIETWARCTLEKLPYKDHIDWKAYRNGDLVALIEFKRRTCTKNQYPTYMISSAKWRNGLSMSNTYGVPFILTVRWADGLYYLHVKDSVPLTLASGGRWDRGDDLDVEEMVYVDTNLFKPICKT